MGLRYKYKLILLYWHTFCKW